VRAGLLVWFATKVGLGAVSAFSWFAQGQSSDTVDSVPEVAYAWSTQWDSTWFIDIAARGYTPTWDNAQAAFFPVYPMLIRLTTPLFSGRGWVAALALANVALLVALVLLFRLADHEFGDAAAHRTLFYLAAFPTAFFLTAPYNEGLFIAFMVATLYCIRRGFWWSAGILGAVAASTRSAGLLMVLPFAYEYLRTRHHRIRLDAAAVCLIPLGLGAVMLTDAIRFGDATAFSRAQSVRFGRDFEWPWKPLTGSVRLLFDDDLAMRPFGSVWAHNVLELGTIFLVLALIVLSLVGPYRMRADQWVFPFFGLALVAFIVTFPPHWIPWPLSSTSRLGLEVIPAFMMLGILGRHAVIDRVALAVFLPVQGILVATFLHGGWIA
jgi:Mannosyltransferase (PIG-V)